MTSHYTLVPILRLKVFLIKKPELYERKDKYSTSNSLSSSSQTLFQIERAHLMDPDMVPDLLWKQGNLYNPKSDEVSLNLLPNLPEDYSDRRDSWIF
jgi:hypothetical protein